jgi:hypothetical protein
MSTTYPDEAVGFQRVLNVLRVLRGLGAQANLGGPSQLRHGSFNRFRGYSRRCHVLESGESLSALWIARYPDSGNERKRVLRVLRCPTGAVGGGRTLQDDNSPI